MRTRQSIVELAIVVLAAECVVSALGCSRDRPATSGENPVRVEPGCRGKTNVAKTQERIAQALYRTVVPHLEPCWPHIKEGGEIELRFTYANQEGNWTFQQVELDTSSLPAAVSAAALECMRGAARGSAFPLDRLEKASQAKEFVITWGWPVPLPPDTSTLARMGPDGFGFSTCQKTCWDCDRPAPGEPAVCFTSCAGYSGCVANSDGNGCSMTKPECARGSFPVWAPSTVARTGQPDSRAAPP